MYCCLHLFTYQVYFYLGTLIFVHGSLLYMHICMTTAVSVHIMYYESHLSVLIFPPLTGG